MEYIAFLFLGAGVLLVLAGVLLNANEKKQGKLTALEEYLHKPAVAVQPMPHPLKRSAEPAMTSVSPVAQNASVPGAFQFMQNEPTPASEPAAATEPPVQVAVSVQKNNPRLFEKFAYLYLDSSSRNVYDGSSTGSLAAFDLTEVNGIRRFGRGVFSYDGFGFYFDHSSGQERFPLANLKTVGFYPNCVALTFRTNQPVALLFMEETESIRKVLETFRSTNAT